jgi:hypothetical protein
MTLPPLKGFLFEETRRACGHPNFKERDPEHLTVTRKLSEGWLLSPIDGRQDRASDVREHQAGE